MGEPCPVERTAHAAVCLGYGGDHPQLLITGGMGGGGKVLKDAWVLDMQSEKWREVGWMRVTNVTRVTGASWGLLCSSTHMYSSQSSCSSMP